MSLLQERAAEYVAGIKQSSDCWKLCVERFGSSMYPEVKFWCLQTLEEVSRCLTDGSVAVQQQCSMHPTCMSAVAGFVVWLMCSWAGCAAAQAGQHKRIVCSVCA
jgi:hypothetical protein